MAAPTTRLEEELYRLYMEFFEKAERERRWNVFDDIPWDEINPDASDNLALCAETFASVEMYLPDYVAGGIQYVGELGATHKRIPIEGDFLRSDHARDRYRSEYGYER